MSSFIDDAKDIIKYPIGRTFFEIESARHISVESIEIRNKIWELLWEIDHDDNEIGYDDIINRLKDIINSPHYENNPNSFSNWMKVVETKNGPQKRKELLDKRTNYRAFNKTTKDNWIPQIKKQFLPFVEKMVNKGYGKVDILYTIMTVIGCELFDIEMPDGGIM